MFFSPHFSVLISKSKTVDILSKNNAYFNIFMLIPITFLLKKILVHEHLYEKFKFCTKSFKECITKLKSEFEQLN